MRPKIVMSKMLWARVTISARHLNSACLFQSGPAMGSRLFTLWVLQRSYVDGLKGLKGRLIRGPIMSRTVSSMQGYLSSVKKKLGQDYSVSAAR